MLNSQLVFTSSTPRATHGQCRRGCGDSWGQHRVRTPSTAAGTELEWWKRRQDPSEGKSKFQTDKRLSKVPAFGWSLIKLPQQIVRVTALPCALPEPLIDIFKPFLLPSPATSMTLALAQLFVLVRLWLMAFLIRSAGTAPSSITRNSPELPAEPRSRGNV